MDDPNTALSGPSRAGKPDQVELEALRDAGALLRFVSERGESLERDLPHAIAEARAASVGDGWTADAVTRFWTAYAQLCQLARPTTVDAIKATQPTIKVRRFGVIGDVCWMSMAQLAAERFIGVLIATLIAVLAVLLFTAGIDSGSRELAAVARAAGDLSANIAQQNTLLTAQTQAPKPGQWSLQQRQAAGLLSDQAVKLSAESASVCQTAAHLRGWLSLPRLSGGAAAAPCPPRPAANSKSQWFDDVDAAQSAWAMASDFVAKVQLRAEVIDGILTRFMLPVLLGLAGAVAYVIRSISEQIKTTTFATVSPLRHKIRVWLGPLMGMIAGLFAQVIQLPANLSPLALAFLAGYAVEAMFSLFDNTFANAAKSVKPTT